MTRASDNPYPSILITEGTEPAAPAAGKQRLYIDSTSHKLKRTDSSGTDVTIEGLSDPTSARGEIIRRGAAVLEALQAKTLGKVLVGDGTDVVSGYPPGYEFAYNEFTSPVSVTATTEAGADVIVTSSAVTYDGSTIVRIEFGCDYAQTPVNVIGRLWLYEKVGAGAAASIGELAVIRGDDATNTQLWPVLIARRMTPSSASIIYSVRGSTASGTTYIDAGAGGAGNAFPGWIRITKV